MGNHPRKHRKIMEKRRKNIGNKRKTIGKSWKKHSHMLHVWNIYQHLPHSLTQMKKNTPYMEHMGLEPTVVKKNCGKTMETCLPRSVCRTNSRDMLTCYSKWKTHVGSAFPDILRLDPTNEEILGLVETSWAPWHELAPRES